MASTISYSSASITGKFLLTYITPYALELYIGIVQIIYLIILFIPLYFIERNGENIFANFFDVFDNYKIILRYIEIVFLFVLMEYLFGLLLINLVLMIMHYL